MKCKCEKEMKLSGTYDNPFPKDGEEYAYNLYHCQSCGMIAKEDVWHSAGITWIHVYGKIEKEKRHE